MTTSDRFVGCAILFACLLAAAPVYATQIQFTIDPSGTANGLVGVAPIAGNAGNYAAGSYLMLTGNISIPVSGLPTKTAGINSSFATSAASGVFSTGNPGSLIDFFHGALNVDLDNPANPTAIALTGGSGISGTNFNKAYAENPGNPVSNLAPASGGGAAGALGSDPADFGWRTVFGFGGIPGGTAGRGALRGVVGDLVQSTPLSSTPLTGPAGNQTFVTNGNLSFVLTSGTYDYNYPGAVILGTTVPDVIGSAAISSGTLLPTIGGPANLTSAPLGGGLTLLRLSIPIQATMSSSIPDALTINTTFTYTGSIAAYAIVPEPGTLALVGAGLASLIPPGMRRWRARATSGTN